MYERQLTQRAATAEMYALAGLAIFPVWWPPGPGQCACPNGRLPNTHPAYCGITRDGQVKGAPGKHPITRNGVKDATTDLDTVIAWWTRTPYANIGLPAGSNNLAIIDVDPTHGGNDSLNKLVTYAASHGIDLMDTMSARSGSGGTHLMYTPPAGKHCPTCRAHEAQGHNTGCQGCVRNGQGNKPPFGHDMPGLDIRGYGGYVVAPPSIHHTGGTYEWIYYVKDPAPWPPLLTAIIEAAYKPAPTAPRALRVADGTDRYAAAALDREVSRVLETGEGGRNAQLNASAYSLGQLVGAGLLTRHAVEEELSRAASLIGLTEVETRATLKSGLDAGQTNPRAVTTRSGAA